MKGILPLTVSGIHIVGPVVTVKYLPYKKRLEEEAYRKRVVFQAALTAKEGDVIVMDAMEMDCGYIGIAPSNYRRLIFNETQHLHADN